MALIKCPNCQKDVSSMVSYCPFCNADLTNIQNPAQTSEKYYDYSGGEERTLKDDSEKTVGRHSSEGYPSAGERNGRNARNESGTANPGPVGKNSGKKQSAHGSSDMAADLKGEESSGKVRTRKSGSAVPGRKLLGFRAGNPFYMFFSVCYHMAACVGILLALSLSPQYLENGTLVFHLCRIILAAIMLFLPVALLSRNKVRKGIPLLGSKKTGRVVTGFILLYIPLAALFVLSWYYCL